MRPPTHPSRRGEDAAPQDEGANLQTVTMTGISIESVSGANAPLEKIALETYVPPTKPSLVGLSRAEVRARRGENGVARADRKRRGQQLWHWIYVRGAANFGEMTSISKEMRTQLETHFTVAR